MYYPPALVASEAIAPYRFVRVDTTEDNTGMIAEAGGYAVGVTNGDSRNPYSATHAIDGDQIRLQATDQPIVECAGTITAGDLVKSDATGQALTGTVGAAHMGRALEAGAVGKFIRIQWQPTGVDLTA
jgi:hypothetical protein